MQYNIEGITVTKTIVKGPLSSFDTTQAEAIVWEALHAARELLIPEGIEHHDDQWGGICTAMAWINEALDNAGAECDV